MIEKIKNFYTIKCKNRSRFENAGNIFLTPCRYLFKGRTYVNAGNFFFFHERPTSGSFRNKLLKTIFALICLVPGILLGTPIKAGAFLQKRVRLANGYFSNKLTAKHTTVFCKKKSPETVYLIGNRENSSPSKIGEKMLSEIISESESLFLHSLLLSTIDKILSLKINFKTIGCLDLSYTDVDKNYLTSLKNKISKSGKIITKGCRKLELLPRTWIKGAKKIVLQNKNPCTELIQALIKDCPDADNLSILDCEKMTDSDITLLSEAFDKNLKKLKINNKGNITGAGLDTILTRFKNIESLDFQNLDIESLLATGRTDQFFQKLGNGQKLKELNLSDTKLHFYLRHLNELKRLPKFRALNITGNIEVPKESVAQFINSFPRKILCKYNP